MHAATVQAIDSELKMLAADERRGLVQFLRRLDLLDQEGGFELFKCGSAYEYLVREHHLAEGTAWRRVNAMKLVRRFPVLEAALEDGRLNPTQLGILGPVLTAENLDEILRAATHLTKRQTEELAVSIVPKKVPAAGLRKLPASRAASSAGELRATSPVMGLTTDNAGPSAEAPSPEVRLTTIAEAAPSAVEGPVAAAPVAAARITPVARAEWQWRIRMDEARMAKLDKLKGMLAHVVPDGDLDRIFDRMLENSLAVAGKRRGFVEPASPRKPAPSKPPTPGERAPVPRSVRREVLKRDGYRCTWVHPDGSRCEVTARLEMDHLQPARKTGSSILADLTTRCRRHNQLRAILRYGRAYVEDRIEAARRAREARVFLKAITGATAQDRPPTGAGPERDGAPSAAR
jgi:hypothetical protein